MSDSPEKLFLVHHGPFTLRAHGTSEEAYDKAIDHLIDNKYYGYEYDEPLAIQHVELHPHDELFRQQGVYDTTVLMGLRTQSWPTDEAEFNHVDTTKHFFGQGTLFRAVAGCNGVELVIKPHFPDANR